MEQQQSDWRLRAECLWRGHEKVWVYTIFTPTWKCSRCGAAGDLDSHKRLPFRDHALALIPVVIVGIVLVILLF